MVTDLDDVAVQQPHEVITAHIEDVVAMGVVLVNLHAPSVEQIRNIIITEECLCYFEATAAAEGTEDVADSEDGVANDVMVVA